MEVTMNSLAASPRVLPELSVWGTDLNHEELHDTVGGLVDPVGITILIFAGSVVVGMIDRWLFGGCRCR
jgi:hypothetical protein